MTGKYLFDGEDSAEILDKNRICDLSDAEEELIGLQPLTRNILIKLIEPDPARRPQASEVLQHSWFSQDKQMLSKVLCLNSKISKI